MNLPIDVVPGSRPLKFRWRAVVSALGVGMRTVEHEGPLPPAVEGAVAELVAIAKQLIVDNEAMARVNAEFAERIAASKMPGAPGELLSKQPLPDPRAKKGK